ncbi:lazarillo protein-like [Hyalella azteca]|uniref:Lazarillo protein-like n=1 Tax=Hyalella azteca TaxID=294128 RepID=A0A8B7PKW5_HYAAZ|nr:lazarillo protein-like [Hyalella azteca]
MMSSVSVVVFAALMNIAPVEASFGFGGCPSQAVVDPFIETTFMGTWYEFGKSASLGMLFSRCPKIAYAAGANGLINVTEDWITWFSKGCKTGQMKKANPSKSEGKYSISFWAGAYNGKENNVTAANYNILNTDYSNYAIIWDCFNAFLFHTVSVRVITRERVPPQAIIDTIYKDFDSRKISRFGFVQRNQQNCND